MRPLKLLETLEQADRPAAAETSQVNTVIGVSLSILGFMLYLRVKTWSVKEYGAEKVAGRGPILGVTPNVRTS